MAECEEDRFQQTVSSTLKAVSSAMFSDQLNFETLLQEEHGQLDVSSTDHSGTAILQDILGMENTEELKAEDESLMHALAQCQENPMKDDEYDDDEYSGDTSGSVGEDSDQDSGDGSNAFEGLSDGIEGFDRNELNMECVDVGVVPDFSLMSDTGRPSMLGENVGDASVKSLGAIDTVEMTLAEKCAKGENILKTGNSVAGKPHKRRKVKASDVDGHAEPKGKKSKKDKKTKSKCQTEDNLNVDVNSLKPSERRRNIRKILGEKDLEEETLHAQKEELERQQRLMELKKQAMSSYQAAAKLAAVPSVVGTSAVKHPVLCHKEPDSQLKSLLQSAEEEADKIGKADKKVDSVVMTDSGTDVLVKQEKVDVIELSSESEVDSEGNDCMMVPGKEDDIDDGEEAEVEDVNDGGAHINDEYNLPDEKGRVLVNVGHPAEDPDIFLSPQMARMIKPHQIGGVRFLYDNLVESLPRFNTSSGFGCILAHSMGLGKTIQVISFIDIFLRHTPARKVLCIVPINTLQNWMAEFNMWAPAKKKPKPPTPPPPPPKVKQVKKRDRCKKGKKSEECLSNLTKGQILMPSGSDATRIDLPDGVGLPHMNNLGQMFKDEPIGQNMDKLMGQAFSTGVNGQSGSHVNQFVGQMGLIGNNEFNLNAGNCMPRIGGQISYEGGCCSSHDMPYAGQQSMSYSVDTHLHGMSQIGCDGIRNTCATGWSWDSARMEQSLYTGMPGTQYEPHHHDAQQLYAVSSCSDSNLFHPVDPAGEAVPFIDMNHPPSGIPVMGGSGTCLMTASDHATCPSRNSVELSDSMNRVQQHSAGAFFHESPTSSLALNQGPDLTRRCVDLQIQGNVMGQHHSSGHGYFLSSITSTHDSLSAPNSMLSAPITVVTGTSVYNNVCTMSVSVGGGQPTGQPTGQVNRHVDSALGFSGFVGNTTGGSVNRTSSQMIGCNLVDNRSVTGALPAGSGCSVDMTGILDTPIYPTVANEAIPNAGDCPYQSPSSAGWSPFPSYHYPSFNSGQSVGSHPRSYPIAINPANRATPFDNGYWHTPENRNTVPPLLSNVVCRSTKIDGTLMPPMASPAHLAMSGRMSTSSPSVLSTECGRAVMLPVSGQDLLPAGMPVSCGHDVGAATADQCDRGQGTQCANAEVKLEYCDAGCESNDGMVQRKMATVFGDDGIQQNDTDSDDLCYRNYEIFLLNDNCKTATVRAKIIGDWNRGGGILLLGYEMYRLLSCCRPYTPKPKKRKKKVYQTSPNKEEVIDVDEEDKNKDLMTDMYGALVNPGPDLVICDEGHRIKNNHANISQALKLIRTRRRVVLTGYPLQNSLMEYWCMVDFVRPNFLGNKTEFSNMFERPIMNGQCHDSTAEDIKIMKHRAYVLHNLLEGFVQRRSHVVLQRSLPFKHEYVFLVRMSAVQRKLYRRFMDSLEESSSISQAGNNPLKAFSIGIKIWNHPDILHKSVVLKKPVSEDNDLDIDSYDLSGNKKSARKPIKRSDSCSSLASTSSLASSMCSVTSSLTATIARPPDALSASPNTVQLTCHGQTSLALVHAFAPSVGQGHEPCRSAGFGPSLDDSRLSSVNVIGRCMVEAAGARSGISGGDGGIGNSSSSGTPTGSSQGPACVNMAVSADDGASCLTTVSRQPAVAGTSESAPLSTGDAVAGEAGTAPSSERREDETSWIGDTFDGYETGLLHHGPKMVLLNTITEHSLAFGDKILVFSQSLSTLDIIEEFMSRVKVPRPDIDERWSRNRSYYRLDGSTSGTERERLINEFNNPTNHTVWMFLLSTRAGCLGINMIGANRVVVLDASWNPCHDCQAVCRVFRFGQTKESFVYRLVTENTLERNIYDRQITKQGMSDRVIDEMNPDSHFSRHQLKNLLKSEDKDYPYLDFSYCHEKYVDPVIVNVLKEQGQWVTKEPYSHESLLIDRKELRMTKKEKLLAKEGYARDKRMNVTYSRPSYATYSSGLGGQQMYIRRGPVARPVASVRPMISPKPAVVQVVKPGITVHQVITTTDILLPGTNTATSSSGSESSGRISSGQKILVIKTPKGVYIRTNDGKMFAVRSKVGDAPGETTSPSESPVSSSTVATLTGPSGAASVSRIVTSKPIQQPRIFFKTPDGKLTEKNPNELRGGSSLLASLYSQRGSVSTILGKKGHVTRLLPAAPVRTLKTRTTLTSPAPKPSKPTKPPVEVIVYPTSKVVSQGRAAVRIADSATGQATSGPLSSSGTDVTSTAAALTPVSSSGSPNAAATGIMCTKPPLVTRMLVVKPDAGKVVVMSAHVKADPSGSSGDRSLSQSGGGVGVAGRSTSASADAAVPKKSICRKKEKKQFQVFTVPTPRSSPAYRPVLSATGHHSISSAVLLSPEGSRDASAEMSSTVMPPSTTSVSIRPPTDAVSIGDNVQSTPSNRHLPGSQSPSQHGFPHSALHVSCSSSHPATLRDTSGPDGGNAVPSSLVRTPELASSVRSAVFTFPSQKAHVSSEVGRAACHSSGQADHRGDVVQHSRDRHLPNISSNNLTYPSSSLLHQQNQSSHCASVEASAMPQGMGEESRIFRRYMTQAQNTDIASPQLQKMPSPVLMDYEIPQQVSQSQAVGFQHEQPEQNCQSQERPYASQVLHKDSRGTHAALDSASLTFQAPIWDGSLHGVSQGVEVRQDSSSAGEQEEFSDTKLYRTMQHFPGQGHHLPCQPVVAMSVADPRLMQQDPHLMMADLDHSPRNRVRNSAWQGERSFNLQSSHLPPDQEQMPTQHLLVQQEALHPGHGEAISRPIQSSQLLQPGAEGDQILLNSQVAPIHSQRQVQTSFPQPSFPQHRQRLQVSSVAGSLPRERSQTNMSQGRQQFDFNMLHQYPVPVMPAGAPGQRNLLQQHEPPISGGTDPHLPQSGVLNQETSPLDASHSLSSCFTGTQPPAAEFTNWQDLSQLECGTRHIGTVPGLRQRVNQVGLQQGAPQQPSVGSLLHPAWNDMQARRSHQLFDSQQTSQFVGVQYQSTDLNASQQPTILGGSQQPYQLGCLQQPSQLGGFRQPSQLGDFQQPPQLGGFQQPSQLGSFQQPSQLGGFQKPCNLDGTENESLMINSHKPTQFSEIVPQRSADVVGSEQVPSCMPSVAQDAQYQCQASPLIRRNRSAGHPASASNDLQQQSVQPAPFTGSSHNSSQQPQINLQQFSVQSHEQAPSAQSHNLHLISSQRQPTQGGPEAAGDARSPPEMAQLCAVGQQQQQQQHPGMSAGCPMPGARPSNALPLARGSDLQHFRQVTTSGPPDPAITHRQLQRQTLPLQTWNQYLDASQDSSGLSSTSSKDCRVLPCQQHSAANEIQASRHQGHANIGGSISCGGESSSSALPHNAADDVTCASPQHPGHDLDLPRHAHLQPRDGVPDQPRHVRVACDGTGNLPNTQAAVQPGLQTGQSTGGGRCISPDSRAVVHGRSDFSSLCVETSTALPPSLSAAGDFSSVASSCTSFCSQNALTNFNPVNPSFFHAGISPYAMSMSPQAGFHPMMPHGLALPGSYPFLPTFHPGFVGAPFNQGVAAASGSAAGFCRTGQYGVGQFGLMGQCFDDQGKLCPLPDEGGDGGGLVHQQAVVPARRGIRGTGDDHIGLVHQQAVVPARRGIRGTGDDHGALARDSTLDGSFCPESGTDVGSLSHGNASHAAYLSSPSVPNASPAFYGGGHVPLGLFPMLGPMSNPMFVPMIPSGMMAQQFGQMQPAHDARQAANVGPLVPGGSIHSSAPT